MKPINVLSLFDGMSCGQIALGRAGLRVNNYFAAEIDKYAKQVANDNYPNTIQLGDVRKVFARDLPKIDLLIGGSPCQGFSFAGKQLNFDDPRSSLFFEFVRVLEEVRAINPKVFFLLENVRMKQQYQDIISSYLGVQPIMIDSNLVSAQNRKRLYWTNIPNVTQPADKGILLKDIVHENEPLDTVLDGNYAEWFAKNAEYQLNKKYCSLSPEKAITMTSRQYASWNGNYWFEKLNAYIVPFDKTLKILDSEVQRGKIGFFKQNSQGQRVYFIHDKAVTLCSEAGGIAGKTGGLYLFGHIQKARGKNEGGLTLDKPKCPTITSNTWQENNHLLFAKSYKVGFFRKDSQANRVYSLDGKAVTLCGESGGSAAKMGQYLFGCITPDRVEKRQNGQRVNDGKKFYTLTAQDQHGVLIEGYIRKLTPIECERLQTVPDNYTASVSNAQRYKMLGNGWTVDIIAHIFKNLIQ